MIGNIFFSFKEIDANGELFNSWVELTKPIWDTLGSDTNDVVSLKRWLAFLEGGLLPIISLTSLHFFIKYEDSRTPQVTPQVEPQILEIIKEVPVEVEKIVEVFKEVPVEKIVEKIVVKEIPVEVEKIVEVVKEVPVEKEVFREQRLTDEEVIERFRVIAANQDQENRKLIYTK